MAQTALQERPANVADFAAPAQQLPAAKPNLAVVQAPQYPPKLVKAVVAIRRAIDPVKKAGEVVFGTTRYNYPKSDDVLDAILPMLNEHGVIVQQSEISRTLFENERTLAITYAYTLIDEDGNVWPEQIIRTGLGMVRDSKGNVDDKAANKASTQSEKYFYIKFFNIRTSDAAQLDNDAVAAGDIATEKQIAAPKPPKPGSAQAKALEGPREVMANSAQAWADAFIGCIDTAESQAELDKWVELNASKLEKLEAHPQESKRVDDAINSRMALLKAGKQTAPKPPKPGAAAPKAPAMPNPAENAAAWIEWLKTKFEGFKSYDEGESYWNGTVEPTLDGLPQDVIEDAMSVWNKFESVWAP